jgi:hypothetical protein
MRTAQQDMTNAHRICAFTVAQALSEILPEGDKEKQMLQGLLGSEERVGTEVRQATLEVGGDLKCLSIFSVLQVVPQVES